ncbi:DUF6090 family protein [Algoriphagus pacificus]|uniref:Uncharacterized protein n=1 Tax=Algoriphagus pacificus TaxID=2811234 RepID=A0ABS3CEH0_9BACT|nr:DUF6090 family protein [Algoriphagus pacificus]MBN7814615.1 hypothetical protein [Algoriphagus pacificus]
MISFFRKIRQKLLQQNRVTRYLVYALGEIMLVVIGILIALQVNNWNEGRKLERISDQSLQSLEEEIKEARSTLANIISVNKRILNDSDLFLDGIMTKDSLEKDPGKIFGLTTYAFATLNFTITEQELSSERTILGGEKLHEKLRISLQDYLRTVDFELIIKNFWNNEVGPFFLEEEMSVVYNRFLKERPISFEDIEKILNEEKFLNLVAASNSFNLRFLVLLENLDKDLEEALALIKQEDHD